MEIQSYSGTTMVAFSSWDNDEDISLYTDSWLAGSYYWVIFHNIDRRELQLCLEEQLND